MGQSEKATTYFSKLGELTGTPIPTVWKSARPRLLWRADKHERKPLPTARFWQELGG